MNLSRETIVDTALDIMDAYGLADLSMRRIATALDVQPSALYWHFPNKQSLLAAVSDRVLADLPPFDAAAGPTGLRSWAADLNAALRRHRSGAEVVSSTLALGRWENGPGAAVEHGLTAAGVAPSLAQAAATGVLYLVLGYAFDADQRAQAAELGVVSDPPTTDDATLDQAVALFVNGLQVSVAR